MYTNILSTLAGLTEDMDKALSELDDLKARLQLFEDRLGLKLTQSEGQSWLLELVINPRKLRHSAYMLKTIVIHSSIDKRSSSLL